MSTFTVVGVSTQYGVTKVRFANDLASRVKLLSKGGHSPLELIELPKAMTKAEACQHLLDVGGIKVVARYIEHCPAPAHHEAIMSPLPYRR